MWKLKGIHEDKEFETLSKDISALQKLQTKIMRGGGAGFIYIVVGTGDIVKLSKKAGAIPWKVLGTIKQLPFLQTEENSYLLGFGKRKRVASASQIKVIRS